MKMKTTVDKLVAVYMEGGNHSKWYPKCLSSKVVPKISDAKLQIYLGIDKPWPVQDRDYVIEAELTRNPETGEAIMRYQEAEGAMPERKHVVRMKKIRGQWKFTPTDDGQVVATYVLLFDPGGSTPSSFINMALSKIGADTFDGMYRYAERAQ